MNHDFIAINKLCIFAIDCVNKTAPVVDYETPYKMIRTTNIKGGFIDLDTVRYVEEETFTKWTRRSKPQYGDVILTREAPVGRVGRYTSEDNHVFLGQRLFHYRPDPKLLDWNFLAYYLQSKKMQGWLNGIAFGATVAHITVEDAETIKIPKIDIEVQRKIGNILANYDDLIENNTQRITLLESMAEELYKEWFVRLRFPGYEDVEVVDGVPEGWERKSLDKYLKYHRGKSYSSEDIAGDTGLPFINLKCIKRNGGFRRDGIKVFNGEYKESNVAHEGDIVMAVTDMTQDRAIVGRVARVPTMNQDKYIVSMDLVKIEPLDIEKDFLYALLRFSGIGLLLKEFANGVNVLHLTPDMIYLQKVTIPVKNLQIKFEKILAPILREIDILNLKNDELKQTRDLLLPRLMSAKLNVEDLDII